MYNFIKGLERKLRCKYFYREVLRPIKYSIKSNLSEYFRKLRKKVYFCKKYTNMNCKLYTVVERSKNIVYSPVFINEFNSKCQITTSEPEIKVGIVGGANAVSGTSLIIHDGIAFYPDLFLPKEHISPAEFNGYIDYNENFEKINLYFKGKYFEEEGIVLFGMITENWAHWILEVIPKLIFVDELGIDAKIPICIDSNVHKNFNEVLDLVNVKKRKVIYSEKYRNIHFKKLVFISPVSYTPPYFGKIFHNKTYPLASKDNHVFSKTALMKLKELVLKKISGGYNYKKIYIHRSVKNSGNNRPIKDLYYIETLAMQKGYIKIDPGDFSFKEQVKIFMNAEKIIAPVGAALVNTIFCINKCKILALVGNFDNADYYYFSNLSGILGNDLYYLKSNKINDVENILNVVYEYGEQTFYDAINSFDSL